jgi:hypothetical protein
MPRACSILVAGIAALALAACGRSDRQAPAPAESLVPLPSRQPAPPVPVPETNATEHGRARSSAKPVADECGADKLGGYLNLLPTSEAMDKIRRTVGHDRIRTINPGDVVTMDLRPDRLNIEVGEDGRIKLFRCG